MDMFGTAIILAGGKSSRMGFDKQFLEIDDKRIMGHITNILEQEFNEIIIVTNKPEEYKDSKYKIITDIIVGKGPLSGIHSGLRASSYKYAYIIGCDMPNINIEYIRYMKKLISTKDIDGCVTRKDEFVETFNSFYSKGIEGEIEKHLLGDRKSIRSLLQRLNIQYIEETTAKEYSPDWAMFSNLNTVEDLECYLDKQ